METPEQNLVIIIIKCFFLCLFICMAVIGNACVIHAIRTFRKLKTIPNLFVLNLAIADLLFALTGMPIILVTTIAKSWTLGDFMCNVCGFLNTFTCSTSIWTLVMISINRYCAVAKASEIKNIYTRQRTYFLIGIVWIFSFLISIPPVFGWSEFISGSNFCTINGRKSLSYSGFVLLIDYIIPFMSMVGLYIAIFILLSNHKKRLKISKEHKKDASYLREETSNTSDFGCKISPNINYNAGSKQTISFGTNVLQVYANIHGSTVKHELVDNTITSDVSGSVFNNEDRNDPSKSTHQEKSSKHVVLIEKISVQKDNDKSIFSIKKTRASKTIRQFFKDMRVTKMLLIVVMAFFVCWTPFLISSLLYAFNSETKQFKLLTFGIMIACMNSIINPIIYAFMNKNFRYAFCSMYTEVKQVVTCRYSKYN